MRVGEALVTGGPPGTAAEPEIVIGELDGPVGQAFAQLIGDQVKGHARVLAIMNTDIMVKPAGHAHGQQGDGQKRALHQGLFTLFSPRLFVPKRRQSRRADACMDARLHGCRW